MHSAIVLREFHSIRLHAHTVVFNGRLFHKMSNNYAFLLLYMHLSLSPAAVYQLV